MKNNIIVKSILAMAVTFSFGAGHQVFAEETEQTQVVLPTSITLNESAISIQKNNTYSLKAIVLPNDAANQEVTWKSGNPEVATVTADGVVLGVAAGKTTIVATSKANPKVTNEVSVTVTPIIPTKLSVNKSSLNIAKGQKYTVNASISPTNADNRKVNWTSSNQKVATVNNKGVVSGISNGTAIILVTADGDNKLVKKINVTVSTKKVIVNKSSVTLYTGKTTTVKATVSPSDATQKTVYWTTSNSKIASVSSKGLIKAKKSGTVTIYAKANSATSAKVKVIVKAPIQAKSVSLNRSTITLGKGSSTKLVATVKPSNTANKKIAWSSSNVRVAKVDQNGKVTAVGVGTTTIKAKTANGKYKTVNVKVVIKPTKKTLSAGTWIVGKNLNPGFYDMTTSEGSGNLIITRGKYDLVVNEILSSKDYEYSDVHRVTAELKKGDKIKIMSLNDVTFTPAKRVYRTNFHSGRYVAGKDIRPGRYTATLVEGSGNLIITRGEYHLVVNEILSNEPGFGVRKVTFTLKTGDDIQISGINSVQFKKH